MADRPSSIDALPVPTLGGLNERPSPANLQAGQFDVLEGLYPAQVGLLRRIPNKSLLASVTGKILSFGVTNNVNGDILIQTTTGLYAFTLDELLGRASTPSLTFSSIAEEETMSMAIIVQKEANGINGGSMQGYLSGAADTTTAVDTWYPRRLTNKILDADSIVATFTTAGTGAGAASSGSFALATGTYRIKAVATFRSSSGVGVMLGLWNSTSGTFEVHRGGAEPIISTVENTGVATNALVMLEGEFTVSGGNKTYELRQKCNNFTEGRLTTMCGAAPSGLTGLNVNGAAAGYYYTYIKLLKIA